jgi:NAD(P)-dependent dehydrogenase (short-subunit alcohol dehydrogenase family)
MNDKIALITGASSGIGFETAREMARRGVHVVMVCRDPERAQVAWESIAEISRGPKPTLLLADLSSQDEIRALADEVRGRFSHLDVLVNNAGGVFERRELTVDGIEKTFATNHLAPFLLTNLLLDRITAAPGGRIVTVASEVYPSALDFANLQGERSYNFLSAYMRSKLENILFTYELARRLEGTAAAANCLSPGPTLTRFGDNLRGLPGLFPKLMKRLPFFVSAELGARTSIYLACSLEVAGLSGRFFFHERERRTKPVTYSADVARRLWSISEHLTGLAAMAA